MKSNKYAPVEGPLFKQPVSAKLKGVKRRPKLTHVDPRFDDKFGHLDIDTWKNDYDFLIKRRQKDKAILEKELENANDKAKGKFKFHIKRLENQSREQEKTNEVREINKKHEVEFKKLVQEGKNPFFINKNKARNIVNKNYKENLQKDKKYDEYLHKKEQRLLKKEKKRKLIPGLK